MTEPEYRHIACSRHGEIPVITIKESHLREATTCYAVRDEVLLALKPETTEDVLVDLTHVEFIGSIGFLVFVGLRRVLTKGHLVLCCVSPPVHDAFRVCRLISADNNSDAPFQVASSIESGAALIAS